MEEAQIHRLDHIIIGSGLETGDLVLDAGTVGNNHDRQVVSLGQPPYLFTEAQAVAFRQIHLSNEQIRGIGAHGIKRLARAAHETHVVRVAKGAPHALARGRVVLHDEQAEPIVAWLGGQESVRHHDPPPQVHTRNPLFSFVNG